MMLHQKINELGLEMLTTWKLAKLQKAEGLASLIDGHIDKLKEIKDLIDVTPEDK